VSCSCACAVVRASGFELVDPPLPPLPPPSAPSGFLLSISTPFLTYIQPPEWGGGGGGGFMDAVRFSSPCSGAAVSASLTKRAEIFSK
jgi:hypothetical protein